jgi:hypothetical protein
MCLRAPKYDPDEPDVEDLIEQLLDEERAQDKEPSSGKEILADKPKEQDALLPMDAQVDGNIPGEKEVEEPHLKKRKRELELFYGPLFEEEAM